MVGTNIVLLACNSLSRRSEDEIFDPIKSLEIFFDRMYDRMIEKRGCLRVGSQVLLYGNLFIFLAFYVLKCLSLMSHSNSLFFNLVSQAAKKPTDTIFSNCYRFIFRSTQL